MAVVRPTFSEEIENLLHAAGGQPISTCIQCGTCSGTCPAVEFMDHTPRRIIGLIGANMKEDVMASNTYWYCASCYHCTVRCPQNIDIAKTMYALKRYSIWKQQFPEGLVGPTFSETFARTIFRSGRSFEPLLATTYLFSASVKDFIQEAVTGTKMILKGRMPVMPPRIKRLDNFKKMIRRVIPLEAET